LSTNRLTAWKLSDNREKMVHVYRAESCSMPPTLTRESCPAAMHTVAVEYVCSSNKVERTACH